MRVRQITNPTAIPISLTEAKDHLRIEQSETAHDNDLTHLIRTAAEWVQDNCHIWLNETEIEAVFETFPEDRQFKLPGWPVQSVDSLQYDDINGTEQTITGFQTDLIDCPASIYPAVNVEWPETQDQKIGAVRVELTVGYPESEIPHMARHLIRLMVGHWFKHREAVLAGTISKEIELTADNLMKMLRVNEFEAFEV